MDLTHQNFDDEIERHAITILDFWAPWCEPCKAFTPIFESLAGKNPDILFARINTDEEQELAKQFEVRSIPTLIAAKDGTILKAHLGVMLPIKFEEMIAWLRKQ